MNSRRYQVAIVEDDYSVRSLLTGHFSKSTFFDCIFSCDTVEKLLRYYDEYIRIDILILDLNLYGKNSSDDLPKLRKLLPTTKIIIYSVNDDELNVKRSFAFSADGYLTKDLLPDEIELKLIELIQLDNPAVSQRIVYKLIENIRSNPTTRLMDNSFSAMEQAVLRRIIQGDNNIKIAQVLNVSVNGIKYHIKNLNKKLQTQNRAELIAKGRIVLKMEGY